MNIQQLIQLKALSPIQLVAGSGQKDIQMVTMMDTPNLIPCLRPHELVITTAYHFQQNNRFFLELVEAMARIDGAGIGIKLNRFLTAIPEEVIAAANEYDVPLMILPETMSLGEMNYIMTEHILKSETLFLTEAMDVQRQLMDLLIKGHQIPRLVRELEVVLGMPLHLFTPYLKTFSRSYTHELLSQALTPELCQHETSFSLMETRKSYTLFHIPTKYDPPFLLIAEQLPLPISKSHHFVLKQALQVLGFALLQHELVLQQQYSLKNKHFDDLLQLPINQPLPSYATDWQLESGFVCIYGYHKASVHFNAVPYQIEQMLTRVIEDRELPFKVFMQDESIVLLYPLKEMARDYADVLKPLLYELNTTLQQFFQLDYQFGVSNPTPNLQYMSRAYQEAKNAAMYATDGVRFHTRKTIFELFEMIPSEDLFQYANTTFKAFQHLSHEEQEVLFETLDMYLETHCQISDTAKQLYVHRNTVLYRLNKCSTLLEKDLKDPDVTMQLRLALRIRKSLQQIS